MSKMDGCINISNHQHVLNVLLVASSVALMVLSSCVTSYLLLCSSVSGPGSSREAGYGIQGRGSLQPCHLRNLHSVPQLC